MRVFGEGPGSPLSADEASKSAKAEELLQLTQGDQMVKMMEPMMKGMVAQMDKDMSAEQRAKVGEMQQAASVARIQNRRN